MCGLADYLAHSYTVGMTAGGSGGVHYYPPQASLIGAQRGTSVVFSISTRRKCLRWRLSAEDDHAQRVRVKDANNPRTLFLHCKLMYNLLCLQMQLHVNLCLQLLLLLLLLI